MGTQQILMLVIGVIIVGIMILVGITMFNLHEYNNAKRQMVTEISAYPPLIVKYCTASQTLGGAGRGDGMIESTLVNQAAIAPYIGFSGANYSTLSSLGEYRVIRVTHRNTAAGDTYTVVISGLGNATRRGEHPFITSTVTVTQSAASKKITDTAAVVVSDAAGW